MESNNVISDLQSLAIVNKKKIWEPFMRKYNCKVICEVGVCRGINFELMIKHSPKEAVAIDAWINDEVISRNDVAFPQPELDRQYEDFKKAMADKPFVKIYRDYSFNVVKNFEDGYFDFVFIDADHTFNGCLRDIEDWYPKVKKGGVLLGDDYRVAKLRTGVEYGVIEAVEIFTSANNLVFFEMPRYGWGIIKA
jgi:hypothetical protein